MDEATETSKLNMGEEEATATARRLCRSYLEHRGMEVVDVEAQAEPSWQETVARSCSCVSPRASAEASTPWPRWT